MTDQHKLRYKRALREYEKIRGIEADRYWQAMLLLVTATEALWEKAQPYLEIKQGNAWLEQMQQQEYLSGSEAGLLTLARNLYNQGALVDIAGLADTFDEENWSAVLEAIKAYRSQP